LAVDKKKEDEMAVEMNEHGFNNVFDNYGTDNNDSDSVDDLVGNHVCKINNHIQEWIHINTTYIHRMYTNYY